MKIVRFLYKSKVHWGVVKAEDIFLLESAPFEKIKLSKKKIPFHNCKLLAPTVAGKIVLVGLNYRDHARELKMSLPNDPVIFLKPPTALIGPQDKIIYPKEVKRLDYEAELALVIRKKGKNIPVKRYSEYILGYTCLNDVTARDLQKKDSQWTRAKSFDTFCPLGPWIETDFNPNKAKIELYLNQKIQQKSTTDNFIFSVPKILSFVSRVMTLLPGDVISTGTPAGIGQMQKGDRVEVAIEGIGRLKNYVS